MELSSDAQQCAVHMMWGIVPVLKVRMAVASDVGGYEWGRWRFARFGEQVLINQVLMQTWKK